MKPLVKTSGSRGCHVHVPDRARPDAGRRAHVHQGAGPRAGGAPSQAAHRGVPQDDAAEEPRAGGLPAERVGADAGEHLLGAPDGHGLGVHAAHLGRGGEGRGDRGLPPRQRPRADQEGRRPLEAAPRGARPVRPLDVLRFRRRERFRFRLRAARAAHRAGGGRARAFAAAGGAARGRRRSSTRRSPTSGASCARAICWCSTTRASFRRGSSAAAIRAAARWNVCSWGSLAAAATGDPAGRGGVGRARPPRPETEAGCAHGVRARGRVLHGEILARRFQGRRTVRLWTGRSGGRRRRHRSHRPRAAAARTSSATIGRATTSATRPCTPPSVVRLPRPPRACTSPNDQLAALERRGRRTGPRDAARRLRHVQAGSGRAGRRARGRSRALLGLGGHRVGAHTGAPRRAAHHRRRHDDRAGAGVARRVARRRRAGGLPATRACSSTPATSSASWMA